MSIFPDAKFMAHVRDPRGVAFSSEFAEPDVAKHPTILSLCRHVRKHLAISFNYKINSSFQHNILVTYYEDSVIETERAAKSYCQFLGIEFEEGMINVSRFKKANGESWPSSDKVYRDTVNDWETDCPEELIETVEFLCHPEMVLHGYKPIIYSSKTGLRGKTFDYIKKNSQNCIGWNTDFPEIEKTLGVEFYRNTLINNQTKLEPLEIKRCFLFDSVYKEIMKRN
jgi:hypothetical protein